MEILEIELVKLFLMSWFFTALIGDLNDNFNLSKWSFTKIFICEKCLSFWITFSITAGDFYKAAFISLAIMIFWKVIKNIKTKL